MSDLQLLFLVLALLYGWECACWVRRGSVAFSTWLGGRWRLGHPGMLLGNQRGGLVFAPPLPPLGAFVTANQFPLSLSPEGALAYVSTSVNPGWRPVQTGRFVRFDEIREIATRGNKLLVNGKILLTASSPAYAARLVTQLRQLGKLAASQRQSAINELLRDNLDAKAVESRWRQFQEQSKPVRLLANVLVLYLFLLAPALIWHFGFKLCWLGLLAGLIAIMTATAVLFYRAHKILYPQADDERLTQFIMILLSPPNTMRAHDILSRPLLESFHPLAVARAFCAHEQLQELARRVWLDLRHPAPPLCPHDTAGAQAVENAGRKALQQAAENFLKQSDLDPEALGHAPTPADESCRAYCPRCEAQFTTPTGTCADCGGLPLVSFHNGGQTIVLTG